MPTLHVRPGAGGPASDRLVLTWSAGEIVRQWLQVTIHDNAAINLPTDIFYVGSAVGDSGNSPRRVVPQRGGESAA